jgi:hypothetical protein
MVDAGPIQQGALSTYVKRICGDPVALLAVRAVLEFARAMARTPVVDPSTLPSCLGGRA